MSIRDLHPNGWQICLLKSLSTKIGSGITPRGGRSTYVPRGVLFIRSQNVHNNQLVLEDIAYITHEQHAAMRGSSVQGNDVLLNITGASLGRSAVVPDGLGEANVNQHVCIIRPANTLNPEYLCYYLLSREGQKQILMAQAGGAREGLNFEQIGRFRVPLPERREQDAIAVRITTWDRAIEQQIKLIEAKTRLKKGLMQQLLTCRRRLAGFTGEWARCNAGQLFVNCSRKNNGNEVLLSVTQEDGAIPRNMLDPGVTMPAGETNNYKLVMPGDFIISLRSFQGGIEYSSYRGIVSPAYTVLKPSQIVNSDFYRAYFKSTEFITRLSVTVFGIRDGKQISYDHFCTLQVPRPCIEEQTEIASVFVAAENELKVLKQKLDALKQQKQGLMQVLLTGKVRVKVAATASGKVATHKGSH